jgi:hypothetical protein
MYSLLDGVARNFDNNDLKVLTKQNGPVSTGGKFEIHDLTETNEK